MPISQSGDASVQTCPRTDGQLLECFVNQRDEAAFEVLVRRHGPMVLGVCHRLLHHTQDAEDAFQATFLVLVRRAATITHGERLGSWLYGVAYRTALEARAAAMRRRTHETPVSPLPEPAVCDPAPADAELRRLLDREINRLPEKYRLPVVLCDLEGRTYREVAQQLGIPAGTLSGRLTTARRRLAQRLTRQGVVLSGAILATSLSAVAASVAVAEPLVAATVATATGPAASTSVAALAEGVLKAMGMKKLKSLLLAVLVLGAAALVVQADWGDSGAAKVLRLGWGQRGRQLAWSPDGKTLAVETKVEKALLGIQYDRRGSSIRLWDVDKGRIQHVLAESSEKGLAFGPLAFSADGKTIATTVNGFEEVILPKGERQLRLRGVVKIWDAKSGALKQTLDGEHSLHGLALSADGKLVAAGSLSAKTIKLWDARTGKLQRTLEVGEGRPGTLAFAPDSTILAMICNKDAGYGRVELWDTKTWKRKHVLEPEAYVESIAFSGNGQQLAVVAGGQRVQLWDARKGTLIRPLPGAIRGIRCVAFSADSRTVAAGGQDGAVHLWDAATGTRKEVLKGHSSAVYALALSPNGKLLASASQDETVRLWSIPRLDAKPR